MVVTVVAAMCVFLLTLPRGGLGHDEDRERAAELLKEGAIQPLGGFFDRAQTLHPGRVIEVEMETEHGRHYYKFEILDEDGVVWEMKFDATSGELIEEERED